MVCLSVQTRSSAKGGESELTIGTEPIGGIKIQIWFSIGRLMGDKIEVDQQGYRAVVGAIHLIVDNVVDQLVLGAIGQNKVVQTPADVPFARRSSSRPEGVGASDVWIQVSVAIEEAAVHQIGEVWTGQKISG